ncbi:MAG: helix-turn-helix domain-containing protein [Candidatus Hodarchaeota archaeon]
MPSYTMNEPLGSYLKRVRDEQHLSLSAVQEKTGLSQDYLSYVESGRIKCPFPIMLHTLARCYGISYKHLIDLAGNSRSSIKLPNTMQDLAVVFNSCHLFRELTDKEKQDAREYFERVETLRMPLENPRRTPFS